MGVATIDHHTFFHNQEAHVEPSVFPLWRREQEAVIQSLKDKGAALVLVADDRSDSLDTKQSLTRSVLLSRESTRLIHDHCC
jgi:hypothetical protein